MAFDFLPFLRLSACPPLHKKVAEDTCCVSNCGQSFTSVNLVITLSKLVVSFPFLFIRPNLYIAKIFGKKFARTSKFIHTNKLWMHTIPTRDCDVLMTFPEKTDDDTLMWLLSRMRARMPELGVHVRHHGHTGVYGFYLTAEYER